MLQMPRGKLSWKLIAKNFIRDHADKPRKLFRKVGKVCYNTAAVVSSQACATWGDACRAANTLYEDTKTYGDDLLSATSALYEDTKTQRNFAYNTTKTLVDGLQIFLLFVLMPKLYVKQFYLFLQEGSKLSSAHESKVLITSDEKASPKRFEAGHVDEDMPGVVKSPSTLSLSTLFNNDMSSSERSSDIDGSYETYERIRHDHPLALIL